MGSGGLIGLGGWVGLVVKFDEWLQQSYKTIIYVVVFTCMLYPLHWASFPLSIPYEFCSCTLINLISFISNIILL